MELEVIINGKGSITVKQEVDWTRKEVEKLAARSIDLINSAVTQKPPYGFEAGTQVQAENASNWYVPHTPATNGIDAKAQ